MYIRYDTNALKRFVLGAATLISVDTVLHIMLYPVSPRVPEVA